MEINNSLGAFTVGRAQPGAQGLQRHKRSQLPGFHPDKGRSVQCLRPRAYLAASGLSS